MGGEARYHGELAPTNNQAEAQGMLLGLELGLAQRWEKAFSGLLVMGDSNLVVAFMQRRSRPGQQVLAAAVTEARCRIKGARGRRVCFKHIPQEQNCLADWLCRVALKMWRHIPEVVSTFPHLGEGDVPPVVLDLQEVGQ